MMKTAATLLMLAMSALPALCQSAAVDRLTAEQLREKARLLVQTASKTSGGSASETLQKYADHSTMLAFRDKSGGAELHRDFADLFYVVDGHCVLVTGGSIQDAKTNPAGDETRGTLVKGGLRQELSKGDVVHIPAKVPHQMIVPEGGSVTYFVVKIK